MSSWKGSSRGGVIGHLFFVFILKYLHISIAYFVLGFVAFYFLFFSPKAFKSLYFFFRHILNRGIIKSVIGIYGNFYRFGQVQLDKISITAGFIKGYKHTAEGVPYLQTMMKNGKGGFLISSHLGGWEISGYFLEQFDLKPKILMLEAEHEAVKSFLENISTLSKPDIIPLKNDLSHVIRITKALKNNQIVALQGDRFLPGSRTMELEFLGKPAKFPVGPFALAVKLDVPVSFVFSTREKGREYRCIASPLVQASEAPQGKNRDEKVRYLATQYVKRLEEFTTRYPDQWFNYYDFWQIR